MPYRPDYPPPVPDAHPLYPASIEEARNMQIALRENIDVTDRHGPVHSIAGVDVGYDIKQNRSRASVVVLSFPELEVIDSAIAYVPTGFPYVPGFLSFRELPAITEALKLLAAPPDLLMVDGQGVAHPRRLGIATHLGLVMDMPSIGVAKSRLVGRHAPVGPLKGDRVPLMDGAERIGTVLRSRDNVAPLYISAGNRVSQDTATAFVVACLRGLRLPEPTRLADKLSKMPKERLLL